MTHPTRVKDIWGAQLGFAVNIADHATTLRRRLDLRPGGAASGTEGAAPRPALKSPLGRGAPSYLVGSMSNDNAYPDVYLLELMRSKQAVTSALAALCMWQRERLRELESELEQLRAGRSDAVARRVVGSADGR